MTIELDRENGLLAGVCAGIARRVDVEPFLVRVNAALLTLLFAPVAIPAYVLAAALLKPRGAAQNEASRFMSWISAARAQQSGRITGTRVLWSAPFAASEIAW